MFLLVQNQSQSQALSFGSERWKIIKLASPWKKFVFLFLKIISEDWANISTLVLQTSTSLTMHILKLVCLLKITLLFVLWLEAERNSILQCFYNNNCFFHLELFVVSTPTKSTKFKQKKSLGRQKNYGNVFSKRNSS